MEESSTFFTTENQRKALCAIATESWKISRVFARAIAKLDAGEHSRFKNQVSYFTKEITKGMEEFGLRVVSVEGQLYDPGMAASPINIDDFDSDDQLVVSQMLEPIIMSNEGLVKAGTVILEKTEK